MDMNIYEKLKDITGAEGVLTDEPMHNHTTFRIGGKVDYLVMPESTEQLREVLAVCREDAIPFFVMGNGSNLLVSDEGYRGMIIQLCDRFNKILYLEATEDVTTDLNEDAGKDIVSAGCVRVRAQAGVMLRFLGNELMNRSLTGFEFATGIPGTIGGAVMMNAGAYGGEIADVIQNATVIDSDGNISVLSKNELELGYRTSIIEKRGLIVLEAEFLFHKGDAEEIKSKIMELAAQRRKKQPLEYPSAGSTFKRPEGHFAGKLISDAGLMGYSIGGAQVSEKHAGFVVNTGRAKAKDVIALTDHVKDTVFKHYGVELELEVKKIGF